MAQDRAKFPVSSSPSSSSSSSSSSSTLNSARLFRPPQSLNRTFEISLPDDLLKDTLASYCDAKDMATLSAASEQFERLPQYKLAFEEMSAELLKFTTYPSFSNLERAQVMIDQNPSLILNKRSFTEEHCGQRKWLAVSPLEYAAWAGDKDLVDSFLKALVTVEQKQEAFLQLKGVKERGTEHGAHLSVVLKLIHQYEEYIHKFNKSSEKENNQSWVEGVGKAQLHSIVNLLQWYCSKYSFDPVPSFSKATDRTLDWWKGDTLDLSADSTLGSSEGLYKVWVDGVVGVFLTKHLDAQTAALDLKAVQSYYLTRQNNLKNQILQLEANLQILEEQKLPEKKSYKF